MTADRKSFLQFVSKLTDLASTYDTEDLKAFRRMSEPSMLWVRDLADALLRIEESASGPNASRTTSRSRRKLTDFYSDSVLNSVEAIVPSGESLATRKRTNFNNWLMDEALFPTNADVLKFGEQFLGIKLGRASRSRIVRRFVGAIEELPSERRRVLEQGLKQVRDARTHGSGLDFLSSWERVIKGGSLSEATHTNDS